MQIYRERVNPKVNVFSVQVAGYDNTVLPDILYRGAILSGWTGKEAKLAYEMSTLWDEVEREEQEPKEQEPKETVVRIPLVPLERIPLVKEQVEPEDDGWVSDW